VCISYNFATLRILIKANINNKHRKVLSLRQGYWSVGTIWGCRGVWRWVAFRLSGDSTGLQVPERLVVLHGLCQTYFVCKSLIWCSWIFSLVIDIPRVQKSVLLWAQKYLVLLLAVSVRHKACCTWKYVVGVRLQSPYCKEDYICNH